MALSMAAATSRVQALSASIARISPSFFPSSRASAFSLSISPSVSVRRWRARASSLTTTVPSAKTVSKVYLVAFIVPIAISIDQLVFALFAGDHDLALVGEVLGDVDHAHLRVVHVLETDGPHGLHVLAQDLYGALGHVGEEDVAQRVG